MLFVEENCRHQAKLRGVSPARFSSIRGGSRTPKVYVFVMKD